MLGKFAKGDAADLDRRISHGQHIKQNTADIGQHPYKYRKKDQQDQKGDGDTQDPFPEFTRHGISLS